MSLRIIEQACAPNSKLVDCDTVVSIVSGIWFRVLCVLGGAGGCGGVSVCCSVFLHVLKPARVSRGQSLCCQMILGIWGRPFSL